jgi:hypothetical protein
MPTTAGHIRWINNDQIDDQHDPQAARSSIEAEQKSCWPEPFAQEDEPVGVCAGAA